LIKHVVVLVLTGIHGSFTPDYLGPEDGEEVEEGEYNILNGVQQDGRLKYSNA
jgi:hypothetical protein